VDFKSGNHTQGTKEFVLLPAAIRCLKSSCLLIQPVTLAGVFKLVS